MPLFGPGALQGASLSSVPGATPGFPGQTPFKGAPRPVPTPVQATQIINEVQTAIDNLLGAQTATQATRAVEQWITVQRVTTRPFGGLLNPNVGGYTVTVPGVQGRVPIAVVAHEISGLATGVGGFAELSTIPGQPPFVNPGLSPNMIAYMRAGAIQAVNTGQFHIVGTPYPVLRNPPVGGIVPASPGTQMPWFMNPESSLSPTNPGAPPSRPRPAPPIWQPPARPGIPSSPYYPTGTWTPGQTWPWPLEPEWPYVPPRPTVTAPPQPAIRVPRAPLLPPLRPRLPWVPPPVGPGQVPLYRPGPAGGGWLIMPFSVTNIGGGSIYRPPGTPVWTYAPSGVPAIVTGLYPQVFQDVEPILYPGGLPDIVGPLFGLGGMDPVPQTFCCPTSQLPAVLVVTIAGPGTAAGSWRIYYNPLKDGLNAGATAGQWVGFVDTGDASHPKMVLYCFGAGPGPVTGMTLEFQCGGSLSSVTHAGNTSACDPLQLNFGPNIFIAHGTGCLTNELYTVSIAPA